MSTTNFKLDPNTPSVFDSVSLDSVVDWSSTEVSTSTDANSDGQTHIQGVLVDNIAADITITCTNPKQFENAAFKVGNESTLVLNGIQRATTGSGTVATTIARTYTNVTVVSVTSTVPHEGQSAATITFRVGDNGSDALYSTT